MNKKERLILEIGYIDEKYIKEAEVKMHTKSIVSIAAVLLVIISVSLFMFWPYSPVTSDLTAYEGSSYYPLIEGIEDYNLSFKQPKYKNNFESAMAFFGNLLDMFSFKNASGGDNMMAPGSPDEAPEKGENGSYVESTDNQVSGVIESDLMKMTDKYIFRLGYQYENREIENEKGTYLEQIQVPILCVYSINKEYSELVGLYKIPTFAHEYFKDYNYGEMFLSLDGSTVTVIKNYTDQQTNKGKVGIISIDVSDISNISTKAMVSIDGSLNTSRMVDGKLLLVSEFFFNRNNVDYSDPATFVPSIDSGDGAKPIEFENIIYPDEITTTRYSVVALLDADDLSLLGANALLTFTDNVYVSKNNVYITREYIAENEGVYEEKNVVRNMTDVAILNYSGDSLEKKGIITVKGWAEDQYSFDEKDGYLRVVTSTRWTEDKYSNVASIKNERNVSLWIYDLQDNSLAYSMRNFAIPGEEATAVRFDGDMVYVCTAVVVNFTDPVYFIDLSDYENIESADTGIIEGYSDHLINLGDGFLLGIGREDWQYSKVEIYEQQGNDVVSVAEFKFVGNYSLDYKSYLVNREHNLFGFGVSGYYEEGSTLNGARVYILLHFNGYEITAYKFNVSMTPDTVRAAYIDGYLYITTEDSLEVEKIQ